MRIWLANSIISSKTAASVPSCPMTSAVLFFQMEFAKCRATYLAGRPVFLANCPGKRVEELVATTVLSGSRGASFS